ncbi:hypothetical protein D3C72_1303660 [compost metagenome]
MVRSCKPDGTDEKRHSTFTVWTKLADGLPDRFQILLNDWPWKGGPSASIKRWRPPATTGIRVIPKGPLANSGGLQSDTIRRPFGPAFQGRRPDTVSRP